MAGADGVVRAEGAHVEGEPEVLSEVSSLLDETSEGALGSSASRREEDSGHGELGVRRSAVDAFAEGTRGIAALEGYRRDEEVCEGMEEVEANAGKFRFVLEGFHPGVVAAQELQAALRDGRAILPIADGLLVQPEEDAFAMDLAGGDPVGREAEDLRLDPEVELPLEVGGHGLDAGESDLGPHLAELSNENDLRHLLGKTVLGLVRARVECVFRLR
jgi:hypothetical protein